MHFTQNGTTIFLLSDPTLELTPLISHTQAKRALRKDSKAFMIYVTEVEKENKTLKVHQQNFLESFNDCFVDDLPPELPPTRPEDHKIEVLTDSQPPHRAPYRQNPLQQ